MIATRTPRTLCLVAACSIGLTFAAFAQRASEPAPPLEWPSYGGDAGALRFSPLSDIRPDNVSQLEVAWVHHSGDVSDGRPETPDRTAYEATPILVDGLLYVCSPFNRVFALDPETGEERWVYDPGVDRTILYANQAVCRGVSAWLDDRVSRSDWAVCRRRIFMGTNDARLIALDARTGRPCAGFGERGEVDLARGVGTLDWPGEYQVTSPPAVIHDLVVVGSATADNRRVDAPSGVVRAYDARSGALRWSWNPLPAGVDRSAGELPPGTDYRLGTPNVWAPMTTDPERDLIFAPTGNSAPDFYGGHRGDSDRYASSVVALRGSTGDVVWSFQTVHHDLWDYDVPAQPTLIELQRDGGSVPALVQATKMGHVFVLERETGRPLFTVEERPVPGNGVVGETLSATQPFPVRPPPLVPSRVSPDDAWGLTPWDTAYCRERIRTLRNEGIFTPPSLQGSLIVPGPIGGSNWGGVAVDPTRNMLIANATHAPFVITLFPAEEYASRKEAEPEAEIRPQRGTPYGVRRDRFLSPFGLPCVKPPWGTLTAVDLSTGQIVWQVPHGGVRDLTPIPIPWEPGTPTLGGPLATGSGLVFIGAAMDNYLRAYDVATGEQLWRGRLDAGGIATPMTYRARAGGRQYVVIAAGGHSRGGMTLGDSLVAFALPD